jgi:hypothetical protein
MRKLKRALSISVILLMSSFAFAGNVDEAIELFDKAKSTIKEGKSDNRDQILQNLRKARSILLEADELTPDQQRVLSKVNSHIYWQIKFSNINEVDHARKGKRLGTNKANTEPEHKKESIQNLNSDNKKLSDPEWEKRKLERQSKFEEALKQAEEYEKKHFKDHHSNLLNYLDLHHKVINAEEGKKVINKTELLSSKIDADKMLSVKEAIERIHGYEKLLSKKNYRMIISKIINILKYNELTPKAKEHIKQMYYETLAMRYLKDTLIMTRIKAIPLPKDTIKGYQGVIIGINEKGIDLINQESEKSSVGWEVVNEKSLLKMAQYILEGQTEKEIHILAFANMRLKNYLEAFRHFRSLIEIDTSKMIRYKDYLTKCEAGYRMVIGPKIDKSCELAKTLIEKGNKKDAIKLMVDLFERYSNDELGQVYQDRILFTYSSILR